MSIPRFVAILLAGSGCAFLPAQAPLDGALRQARRQGVPWVLVHRAEDGQAFVFGDDELFRLRFEGQLLRMPLEPQAAREVWQDRGWSGQPHWILVSASGEEAGNGPGIPSGPKLLELLKGKGLKPRWEERRAFLKEHPGNGEAWAEEVDKSMRLARVRMNRLVAQGKATQSRGADVGIELPALALSDPDPEARQTQADLVFEDVAAALDGAQGVEGWWMGIQDRSFMLSLLGASDSPRVHKVCHRLAEDLEQTLRRRGPELILESRWIAFRAAAGDPVTELPEFVRLPGEFGPSPTILSACASALGARKRWEGVLALLDGLPGRDPLDPWTPEAWRGWCQYQQFVSGMRIRPLWELGRKAEARKAAEDLRAWSGSDWPKSGQDPYAIGSKVLQETPLQAVLLEAPLPDPPMPVQGAPLRISLLGDPDWKGAWQALGASKALLPWTPGELVWDRMKPEEALGLKARRDWGDGARWVVLRGTEVLATGTACPDSEVLAALLEREGPSRLHRLNRVLEAHPEHLGARRQRMALLKARMPEPRLEELLAEDARATFEPENLGIKPLALDFGPDAPWKPDPRLWQWSAQRVLPRLETLLRAWPSHPGFWKGWLAWARFHPGRPSVVALARTLNLWQSRHRWIGALPVEVHRAVAQELRLDRNYPELARWMEEAWEAVDKTPGSKVDPDAWGHLQAERERLKDAILAPLAEALRMLKRDEEARGLEARYRGMMTR